MTNVSEEVIRSICKEVNSEKEDELFALFIALADEENQVIHQLRPHRIIKKISAQIDEYLEE